MSQVKTQIENVRFNPAEEAFEGLVTFHTDVGVIRVATQFTAPLTASFDVVSNGLTNAALSKLYRPGTMFSLIARNPIPAPQMDTKIAA